MLYCLPQEKRLRDRQTETEESLQKRLEAARIDIELSRSLHTATLTLCQIINKHLQLIQWSCAGKEPGVFDIVIINDDVEQAYEELKDILSEVSKTMKYIHFLSEDCDIFIIIMSWTSLRSLIPPLSPYRKSKKLKKPNHKSLCVAGQKSQHSKYLVDPRC